MRGLAAGCCLILLAATTAAQSPERLISLPIAKDFPKDLPVIVAGELRGQVPKQRTLLVSHPSEGGQLLAQVESSGNRVWLPLTADESLSDKRRLELPAEPVEATARVRIMARPGGYEFHDQGRSVLFYQSEPLTRHGYTRAGFVHPLRGLAGETFTEIFPADHRHHQGVFWAWHQLWVGDRKIGDPWVAKDHLVVVTKTDTIDEGPLFATFRAEAEWQSPLLQEAGQPVPIVKEQTTIRVFHAQGNSQYVDFTIILRAALPNVRIGGSENAKGYSGFTVRVKPPDGLQIYDTRGRLTDDQVQTASAWADVSGPFQTGHTSGVGILSHPSLAEFPPRWLLRHYGMQNVAYPGREPITLSTDRPLVLRYRLVLHRGHARQSRIADHQRVFESTP